MTADAPPNTQQSNPMNIWQIVRIATQIQALINERPSGIPQPDQAIYYGLRMLALRYQNRNPGIWRNLFNSPIPDDEWLP